MSETMKLYGSYTSPYVRHCRVAFAQAGIEYDFVEADFSASAAQSPMAKVPFLQHGTRRLSDSSSIVKYIREQSGAAFLADLDDYETFAIANTLLDSAVNVFLLESEGLTATEVKYVARQQKRIVSGLNALNARLGAVNDGKPDINRDGDLRCACFLAWGVFRNRIDIDGLIHLRDLLGAAERVDIFNETAPPSPK